MCSVDYMKYLLCIVLFICHAFSMMECSETKNVNCAFNVNYNLVKAYVAEAITRKGVCDDIISKNIQRNDIFSSKRLRNSVLEVIPRAIADCVVRQNEFTGAVYRVVTFNASPNKCIYSRANWNAVIIYNYLKFCRYQDKLQGYNMNGLDKKNISVKNVGQYVLSRYMLKYNLSEKDIETYQSSISDIEEYDRALGLSVIIKKLPSVCDIIGCKHNYHKSEEHIHINSMFPKNLPWLKEIVIDDCNAKLQQEYWNISVSANTTQITWNFNIPYKHPATDHEHMYIRYKKYIINFINMLSPEAEFNYFDEKGYLIITAYYSF